MKAITHLLIFLIASLFYFNIQAEDSPPVFDYGLEESHFDWGLLLPKIENDPSDLQLRIGTRLQGIIEDKSTTSAGVKSQTQDFYVRRARFQIEGKFQKDSSVYFDIRSDSVDRGNDGENVFSLGDAFFQVKKVFNNDNLTLRLFRAKYDMSRSQTVSSSRLLILNRAPISDYASNFISQARRGTNIQILGNWNNKIQTQLVIGDSVQEETFLDSIGKKSTSLNSQNLAMGARIRVSPFNGWVEEGLTETFFGKGKHFSIGASYFTTNNINFTANGLTHEVDHKLSQIDLSFHYQSFSLVSEYFLLDGMVDNFASTNHIGKSDGGYAQIEYVFTQFHYLAPYFRHHQWNRFKSLNLFSEISDQWGLNYYLKGNKLRLGISFEKTTYDLNLAAALAKGNSSQILGANFMMHY